MDRIEPEWIVRILDLYDKVHEEKSVVGKEGADDNA